VSALFLQIQSQNFLRNLISLATWGAIVVLLLAAGAILFLIGLAAVLPILGHATWHLYRKVVE
jgi:uncharacterized membrane protein